MKNKQTNTKAEQQARKEDIRAAYKAYGDRPGRVEFIAKAFGVTRQYVYLLVDVKSDRITEEEVSKLESSARIIPLSEMVKRVRVASSVVEKLKDWPVVKEAIDNGLPEGYISELRVPLNSRLQTRTITKFLKKYIKASGRRYSVKHFNRAPLRFFYVTNTYNEQAVSRASKLA